MKGFHIYGGRGGGRDGADFSKIDENVVEGGGGRLKPFF